MAVLGLLLAWPAAAQQGATLSGRVTDAQDGQPLIGANVVLLAEDGGAMVSGAASDADGRYRIAGVAPGSYVLAGRFVGYQEWRMPLTLAAGEARAIDIALEQVGFDLNTVVVSASRQEEKVLDAPASISVLTPREIQEVVSPASVDALRTTTGVDIAQTGVNRKEIVIRGFNNAFSGATYVLTDYRQAAVPSLGVNIYSIMPNMAIDLDRIEVVRGPGSALYGAGVDAGVIHFVTKDPFTYPGTTVSVSGGERALFAGQLRHAGVVAGNLGYKVTAAYSQADEWELDPDDPQDQVQLDDIAPGLVREYDFQSYNVNGTLEYRFAPTTRLIANVGHSRFSGTALTGIGTVEGDGFGYSYGQLRFQSGAFFAQAYVNMNDAGDSYLYGTGQTVVDNGRLYNAQAQYDFNFADGRQRLIVGADAEVTRPDTDGTILGRNEDDDNITEYGLYAQSTTQVTPQLDLTLALRGDYNQFQDESVFQLSPRAAVVYKVTPQHSLRASYNRAFSSPGTNSLFLDIVAGQIPGTNILLRGRGSVQGFTFERNAAFGAIAGSDLVASSLNPATLGAPQPIGLPLDAVYGSVYAGLAAIPPAQLQAILAQQGLNLPTAVVGQLVQLLSPQATTVQGFSRGRLVLLNPSATTPAEQFVPIQDVSDIDPLKQKVSQVVEAGYKGIFQNRVLVEVDAYYASQENFVGPLLVETPFVVVPQLSGDLAAALAAGIQGNAALAGAIGQFGLTPAQVAQLIVGLAAQNLPSASTPVAIVQPVENNPGVGQTPEVLLAYRNFGKVQYYGADVSVQVAASEALTIFGNVSFVSDDFFDNEELEETNTELAVALNAPSFKTRLGFSYAQTGGLSFNMAGRYTEGFPVRSGPYVGGLPAPYGDGTGGVESYFLLDVGAGYDLGDVAPGLRFDVTVSNVLDNEHREFVGAPKLGRMAMARLMYSF